MGHPFLVVPVVLVVAVVVLFVDFRNTWRYMDRRKKEAPSRGIMSLFLRAINNHARRLRYHPERDVSMRRLGNRTFRSRQDANHSDIVKDLKKLGYQVHEMKSVGGGFPDILVAQHGKMCLMEIKTEDGELNHKQKKWYNEWQGPEVPIIRTTEQAIIAMMKL